MGSQASRSRRSGSSTRLTFQDLPLDLIQTIALFCPTKDLFALSGTCRALYGLKRAQQVMAHRVLKCRRERYHENRTEFHWCLDRWRGHLFNVSFSSNLLLLQPPDAESLNGGGGGGNRNAFVALNGDRGGGGGGGASATDFVTDQFLHRCLHGSPVHALRIVNCRHVTNEAFEPSLIRHLQILDISGCHHLTDDVFTRFRNGSSPIHTLVMSSCQMLTAKALMYLSYVPTLQSLNISYCHQFSDGDIAEHLPRTITCLNVSGCAQLTDQALSCLRQMKLKRLDVSYLSQITDETFERHVPHGSLTHLRMVYCGGVTDRAFECLRGSIQCLDMSGCSQSTVTDDAFDHLRGTIQVLRMNYCSQETITDRAFTQLKGTIRELCMYRCHQRGITDEAICAIGDSVRLLHIDHGNYTALVTKKSMPFAKRIPRVIYNPGRWSHWDRTSESTTRKQTVGQLRRRLLD